MSEETKEILFQLEIVARKHTIKVLDTGNIETMPASVVDELRLNNYSAKILLNYITNLQKENENLLYEINGYLKEKEELKEKINKLEDYKQRNEKAVEYIKEWWYEKNTRDINRIVSLGDKRIDLYNILQGENDD